MDYKLSEECRNARQRIAEFRQFPEQEYNQYRAGVAQVVGTMPHALQLLDFLISEQGDVLSELMNSFTPTAAENEKTGWLAIYRDTRLRLITYIELRKLILETHK